MHYYYYNFTLSFTLVGARPDSSVIFITTKKFLRSTAHQNQHITKGMHTKARKRIRHLVVEMGRAGGGRRRGGYMAGY